MAASLQYDPDFDTLTLTLVVSKNTLCWEAPNGILYRYDPVKRKLLGLTIMGLSHRKQRELGELLTVEPGPDFWRRIDEAEGKWDGQG